MIVAALVALGRNVLVTAQTHSAVDSILLKCAQFGVSFVRLGRRTQVRHTTPFGMSGFHFRGGGGGEVTRAPKIGGGGVWEKGSIDRHH